MKTILVDAIHCFINDGVIFSELHDLLETYPNRKIILTSAPHKKFEEFGLDKMPYEVFTLQKDPPKTNTKYFSQLLTCFDLSVNDVVYFEHDVHAVKSAQKIGILTQHYDPKTHTLQELKEFLDANL